MYSSGLKKEAVEEMKSEASKLKEKFMDYVEDLELYSNPEFWKAVEELESGKAKKVSMEQFKKEIKSK